jgi:hypothetical protein
MHRSGAPQQGERCHKGAATIAIDKSRQRRLSPDSAPCATCKLGQVSKPPLLSSATPLPAEEPPRRHQQAPDTPAPPPRRRQTNITIKGEDENTTFSPVARAAYPRLTWPRSGRVGAPRSQPRPSPVASHWPATANAQPRPASQPRPQLASHGRP